MTAQTLPTKRFIRKTQLSAGEYRKNFHQIDEDIIAAVSSREADAVTPLMSKIYLRLVNAPVQYREQAGVLRFEAAIREGIHVKAWKVFCEVVGVASATAHKALMWMHQQGIIGYFSGKNGVGLRIFLNRAANSIGIRTTSSGKKILQFDRASSVERPASLDETTFNDSFAVREVKDIDLTSDAPKDGANSNSVNKNFYQTQPLESRTGTESTCARTEVPVAPARAQIGPLAEIISRLKSEIEPCLKQVAAQAASQATRDEIGRTRAWFETKALPKAVRVAQSECYNLLKKNGSLYEKSLRDRAGLEVGRSLPTEVPKTARLRTSQEVNEIAEICLALLATQGQSIETTLAGISVEAGGCLPPEDAPRVRAAAELMLAGRERGC